MLAKTTVRDLVYEGIYSRQDARQRVASHEAEGLEETSMPTWAWIVIILLIVLLLGGGYGYRRRG
jgi:cobalamin biosynthesis Mg chelatase CobN